MNQVPIKLGPLTLLLTVISICLTTLAILTFTTARADMRLSEKYAQTVMDRYELEQQGQNFISEIKEAQSKGLAVPLGGVETDENGVIWKTFEKDRARLRIGLTMKNGQYYVTSWKQDKEWDQNTDIGNLW